jgi:hypothetical protein
MLLIGHLNRIPTRKNVESTTSLSPDQWPYDKHATPEDSASTSNYHNFSTLMIQKYQKQQYKLTISFLEKLLEWKNKRRHFLTSLACSYFCNWLVGVSVLSHYRIVIPGIWAPFKRWSPWRRLWCHHDVNLVTANVDKVQSSVVKLSFITFAEILLFSGRLQLEAVFHWRASSIEGRLIL